KVKKASPASTRRAGFDRGSGGAWRSRTALDGFAIRRITALLTRRFVHPTKKGSRASLLRIWSGKRGSNSRPQPWQGCALPTELFPRFSAEPSVLQKLEV